MQAEWRAAFTEQNYKHGLFLRARRPDDHDVVNQENFPELYEVSAKFEEHLSQLVQFLNPVCRHGLSCALVTPVATVCVRKRKRNEHSTSSTSPCYTASMASSEYHEQCT